MGTPGTVGLGEGLRQYPSPKEDAARRSPLAICRDERKLGMSCVQPLSKERPTDRKLAHSQPQRPLLVTQQIIKHQHVVSCGRKDSAVLCKLELWGGGKRKGQLPRQGSSIGTWLICALLEKRFVSAYERKMTLDWLDRRLTTGLARQVVSEHRDPVQGGI
jgi:hypothetical protein